MRPLAELVWYRSDRQALARDRPGGRRNLHKYPGAGGRASGPLASIYLAQLPFDVGKLASRFRSSFSLVDAKLALRTAISAIRYALLSTSHLQCGAKDALRRRERVDEEHCGSREGD